MKDCIEKGQYNLGHICTRQQCERGRAGKVAVRWVPAAGERRDYTYADLETETNRFASALQSLGLVSCEPCFTFLPRMPEQLFAFLGALKLRLVSGTLFANFGEEALLSRLGDAGARVLVTRTGLLKRVLPIRDRLPELRWIILVDADVDQAPNILSYRRLVTGASPEFLAPPTGEDTPSVLHYTSGSTGKPKGVLHRHGSVMMQRGTAREILGLQDDDRFWCTADPGWVTGTSYGIIGPCSLGVTQLHYGGGYDAAIWSRLLIEEGITVWYTAPTALRMLMRDEAALPQPRDLQALRSVFSVGEPLNPEVIAWGRRRLSRDIHDTWFQTETGAIMVANRPGLPLKPGSMGVPVPGIEVSICDDAGAPVPEGAGGNLCLRPGWPAMFIGYLNSEAAYRAKFRHGRYVSGDIAHRDSDGYIWFHGRSDDVINTAGHLISPFEVESALLERAEVAESAVIGVPDDLLFEKVVAYVCLRQGVSWSRELELAIRLHLSNKVSTIATPQEIILVDRIPKNRSGKIMRRVLKARYLGTDAGDLSTLEE